MSSQQSVGRLGFSYFCFFSSRFEFTTIMAMTQTWTKLHTETQGISCDVCACVDNAINTWTDTDCLFIFSPISLTRFIGLTLNFDETGFVILFGSLSLCIFSFLCSGSSSSSSNSPLSPLYNIQWMVPPQIFPYITNSIYFDAIRTNSYDSDFNHAPCLKNGLKAHWAVIIGCLIDDQNVVSKWILS